MYGNGVAEACCTYQLLLADGGSPHVPNLVLTGALKVILCMEIIGGKQQ